MSAIDRLDRGSRAPADRPCPGGCRQSTRPSGSSTSRGTFTATTGDSSVQPYPSSGSIPSVRLDVAGQLGLELLGPQDQVRERPELSRVRKSSDRSAQTIGLAVKSVTLCSSQSLPIVRPSSRVEVIDHFLAQAKRRPDRDGETERVEERQDSQQAPRRAGGEPAARSGGRCSGYCGAKGRPPWDRRSIRR